MASEAAAQAVQVVLSGPLVPSSSETCAAPMLGIIIGTSSGLVRSGPWCSSLSVSTCRVCRPPTPLAMTAPVRSASAEGLKPASSLAILAAATAYLLKRSSRRALRLSMKSSATKPWTSAAMRTLYADVSKRVM